jgi:hypothetical protein
MAARLGQTVVIIRYALLLLESHGKVTLADWEHGDELRVAPPQTYPPDKPAHSPAAQSDDNEASIGYRNLLTQALAEVRAYRRYFLRVAPDQLGLARVSSAPTPQHDRRTETP